MSPSYPDVIPMIAYEDGPRAMDWLADVFGFKERARPILIAASARERR
jgi:uncharacterized glyoxalase superfamily protein PhnB